MSTAEVGSMRVVVVGATGNVGTSVLRALGEEERVGSVLGLARRVPRWSPAKTTWAAVDISEPGPDGGTGAGTSTGAGTGAAAGAKGKGARESGAPEAASEDELVGHFRDADAVVHLAWQFQPTHDPVTTWRTNVLGGLRVLRAVAAAEVPVLVFASSVGAYSPGPKDRAVDESWPTHGWPEAAYCREKAYLERALDTFEYQYPRVRLVRMRPGFIFKRQSASEQRRLFAGPLLPGPLIRPGLMPIVPDVDGLRLQVLHADDVGEAYRLAVVRHVRGAFNLAADPVVDAAVLAEMLRARVVRLPRTPLRSAMAAAWLLRLAPASPHLFDAALRLPLMDTSRARDELGWSPRYSATETLEEFLEGLRHGAGAPTAPLAPGGLGGRARQVAPGT